MPPCASSRGVVQSSKKVVHSVHVGDDRGAHGRENDMRHAEEDALRRRKEEEKYHNHATHVKVSAPFVARGVTPPFQCSRVRESQSEFKFRRNSMWMEL